MNLIIKELKTLADPQRAQNLQRFFKTGKGEYGEGDLFLGLKVPQVRQIIKKYWKDTNLVKAEELLHNKYHEVRLCALLILVEKFKNSEKSAKKIHNVIASDHRERGNPLVVASPDKSSGRGNLSKIASLPAHRNDERIKDHIFQIYINNTKYINNWDLVDQSAGYIVGQYLADKPKGLLYKFAKSKSLWERRIAVISTLYFIVFKQESKETIKIAKILLHDPHDLIHKAVGWMLREVGKRVDEKILTDFLDQHYKTMPRTMLRYSIERLGEDKRRFYLNR